MKDFERKVTHSLVLLSSALLVTTAQAAGTIKIDDTRSVTIGGGMRAGFAMTENGAPNGTDDSKDFSLQSARLYVSGTASDKIKFTFNTECKGCVFGSQDTVGSGGDIDVLDAIAQFELNPMFNIWVGRMLTPADRIEMNGPYYGLSWNQYTVPLLPSDQVGQAGLLGRDDGVTVWGGVGKFAYAAGLFKGLQGGANQKDSPLFATRLSFSFLGKEDNPAYYTSSTYYGGGGDIATLGFVYQKQSDGTGTAAQPGDFDATILDFLYEKSIDKGKSAFTVEAEYKKFNADLTPAAKASAGCFCLFDGTSYFVTAAYLLPSAGKMKWQPYIRHTSNEPSTGASSDLNELGLNMIMRGHNARMNVSYTDGDANLSGAAGTDAHTLSFGVQIQI
ncbi:MAG: porin [Gammaproteobacteria bacterium]